MFTRRPVRLGAAVIVVLSLVAISSLVAVSAFGPASSLSNLSDPIETATHPGEASDTELAYTLVVADAETGETLLEIPVEDRDTVTLAYTHSVEKTTIEDVYVVDGTTLRMTEMRFQSHGAGLPSDESVHRDGEWFVVDRDDRYETVRVAPGAIAGHELVLERDQHGDEQDDTTEKRYDLVERSDGPVTLTIRENGGTDPVSRDSNNDEKPG
ncbi:DUF1850 domain-containing protein [Halobacteria archaeon AArc-curdl1]|uniref:DUF1850 domain-containing protein n=1 Tax=Natronosalvus hydrolyticus TaxID=2979988 RepID=A0AAP2Z6Q1_9EURY|nr:DUF1850 domain-containing protein [Halobacteria archaeon AArc-curdl1]